MMQAEANCFGHILGVDLVDGASVSDQAVALRMLALAIEQYAEQLSPLPYPVISLDSQKPN